MAIEVRIRKKLHNDSMLDVNFKSEEGIFSLLGDSESGKSMVLLCVAGLETPDEGHIEVDHKVWFDSIQKINLAPQERHVGMLFHGFALFPTMTVEENIRLALQAGGHKILEQAARREKAAVKSAAGGASMFGAGSANVFGAVAAAGAAGMNNGAVGAGTAGSVNGSAAGAGESKAKKRRREKEIEFKSYDLAVIDHTVNDFLHEYHLDGLGGMYPDELQGAQKLWVAIARMMAGDPKVVLLDEPFKDLDGYRRATLLYEVRDFLREKKLPGIFVSADRDEVYAMSDWISVVEQGKSREPQKRENFFRHPVSIGSALLSGVRNVTAVSRTDEYHALASEWGILFSFPWEDPEGEKQAEEKVKAAEKETEKPAEEEVKAETEAEEHVDAETKAETEKPAEEEVNAEAETDKQAQTETLSTALVIKPIAPGKGNTGGKLSDKPAGTDAHAGNAGSPKEMQAPAHPRWEKLPEDLQAIGIDGKDFLLERSKDDAGHKVPSYKFSVYVTRVEEDLENWNVYFRTLKREDAGNLIWTVPKTQMKREEIDAVKHLYVANERILKLL